jgi:hypothetical protein
MLAAALRYARAGFRVLPLFGAIDGACACGRSDCPPPNWGKHPIRKKGAPNPSTTDPATIRRIFARAFARWPAVNLGGYPPVGVCVVDVDRHPDRPDGVATLRKLMAGKQLPVTPVQRTGGNGWHLFFKGAPSVKVGEGIDTVKPTKYVVLDPSIHVSGRAYEMRKGRELGEVAIAPLIAELQGGRSTEREDDTDREPIPLDEVVRALGYLPADDYNEQFIRYGQALRHDHGQDGYKAWFDWIKTSGEYKPGDEKKWQTFDQNRGVKPVTCATIISDAQALETGYVFAPEFTAFREESRTIGEGPEESGHHPNLYTLEEMLKSAVYISEGSQVALRDDPRLVWSFSDFESLTAASKLKREKNARPENAAKIWLQHRKRDTVHARTFRAGGELFCQSPDDVLALNTWREPPRAEPPNDWRKRAQPFIDHVKFLVPNPKDRIFFANWLAHIEQAPGVLPHIHVLMIAIRHGIGRNWLSSVLARVWAGVTALDVDLPQLLDGGFNGRLSRKILAVINEIHEGGGARTAYRHADRLKGLLTDERRSINPKFGRQYDEVNSVRWLIFSNHENALPLDRFDRRVYAIENPAKPKPLAYYTKLYALAADPKFIASVRELLRTCNIAGFNPGMHAPLNETKQKVIDAAMSDADRFMLELVEKYPSDCITAARLLEHLEDVQPGVLQYTARRAGASSLPGKTWLGDTRRNQRIWILRNREQWLQAAKHSIASEVLRGEKLDKQV